MPDREKVIKGLECCCSPTTYDCKNRCPYTSLYEQGSGYKNCMAALLPDALALLKEQEAKNEHLKRPDCEHAEHDRIGCLGYCGCTQDDEPIDPCKRCAKYTCNVCEAAKRMDREKVIKGIECHRKKVQTTNAVSCLECPYAEPKPIREWCMSGLMDDIYAMLKEQEAVMPKVSSVEQRCGNCNKIIEMDGWKACPWCGKPILWEAVGRSVR